MSEQSLDPGSRPTLGPISEATSRPEPESPHNERDIQEGSSIEDNDSSTPQQTQENRERQQNPDDQEDQASQCSQQAPEDTGSGWSDELDPADMESKVLSERKKKPEDLRTHPPSGQGGGVQDQDTSPTSQAFSWGDHSQLDQDSGRSSEGSFEHPDEADRNSDAENPQRQEGDAPQEQEIDGWEEARKRWEEENPNWDEEAKVLEQQFERRAREAEEMEETEMEGVGQRRGCHISGGASPGDDESSPSLGSGGSASDGEEPRDRLEDEGNDLDPPVAIVLMDESKHYLAPLDLPTFDMDLGYIPHPEEKDAEWSKYMNWITDPPFEGMLRMTDPEFELRGSLRKCPSEVVTAWNKVLKYFDHAMNNQLKACRAVLDAHRQMRIEQRQLKKIYYYAEKYMDKNWYWEPLGVDRDLSEIGERLEKYEKLEQQNYKLKKKLAEIDLEEEIREVLATKGSVPKAAGVNIYNLKIADDHPQIVALHAQLQAQNNIIKKKDDELQSVRDSNAENLIRLDEIKVDLWEAKAKVEELKAQVFLASRIASTRGTSIPAQVISEEQAGQYEEAILAVEEENGRLKEQIDDLNRETRDLDAQIVTLEREHQRQETENRELKQRNIVLREAMTEREAEIYQRGMSEALIRNKHRLDQSLMVEMEDREVEPDEHVPPLVRDLIHAAEIARMPLAELDGSLMDTLGRHLHAANIEGYRLQAERDRIRDEMEELERANRKRRDRQPTDTNVSGPSDSKSRDVIARLNRTITNLKVQQRENQRRLEDYARHREQYPPGSVVISRREANDPHTINQLYNKIAALEEEQVKQQRKLDEYERYKEEYPPGSVRLTEDAMDKLGGLVDWARLNPVQGSTMKGLVEKARIILGTDNRMINDVLEVLQRILDSHAEQQKSLDRELQMMKAAQESIRGKREAIWNERDKLDTLRRDLIRKKDKEVELAEAKLDEVKEALERNAKRDQEQIAKAREAVAEQEKKNAALTADLQERQRQVEDGVKQLLKRKEELDKANEQLEADLAAARKRMAEDEERLQDRKDEQAQKLLEQQEENEKLLKQHKRENDAETSKLIRSLKDYTERRIAKQIKKQEKEAAKTLAEKTEKLDILIASHNQRQQELEKLRARLADKTGSLERKMNEQLQARQRQYDEQEALLREREDVLELQLRYTKRAELKANAKLVKLERQREKMELIIQKEIEHNNTRADQTAAAILLELRMKNESEVSASEACFCSLLRVFFPRVYHAAVRDGCCATLRISPVRTILALETKTITSVAKLKSPSESVSGSAATAPANLEHMPEGQETVAAEQEEAAKFSTQSGGHSSGNPAPTKEATAQTNNYSSGDKTDALSLEGHHFSPGPGAQDISRAPGFDALAFGSGAPLSDTGSVVMNRPAPPEDAPPSEAGIVIVNRGPDPGAGVMVTPAPACPNHHGHGHLRAGGLPWVYVCQILTSALWLVLLALMQFHHLHRLFLFHLSLFTCVPPYLVRLAWFALCHQYYVLWPRIPASARPFFIPVPEKPPRPQLWLERRPSAAALVGVAVTTGMILTFLAAEATRVERDMWLGESDWRWVYMQDLMWKAPYPPWSPYSADYRLTLEPLTQRLVSFAHGVLFWGGGRVGRGWAGERLVRWLVDG